MDWRRRAGAPERHRARDIGAGVLAIAVALGGGALLLPLLVRAFVRALELVMTGCVWMATSISVGVSAWTVAASVGRAVAAVFVTREGSAALGILVLIAVGAFYALQRLLGSHEELSR
jgi:uncharacterized membrane protein